MTTTNNPATADQDMGGYIVKNVNGAYGGGLGYNVNSGVAFDASGDVALRSATTTSNLYMQNYGGATAYLAAGPSAVHGPAAGVQLPNQVQLPAFVSQALGTDVNGMMLAAGQAGFVTPEMFGAKGNGTTPDDVALDAAVSSGKPILLLNQYLLIAAHNWTVASGKSLTMVGASSSSKLLLYVDNPVSPTTYGRLKITIAAQPAFGEGTTISLRDFDIVPQYGIPYPAITFVGTGACAGPTLKMRNVNLVPLNNGCSTQGGYYLQDMSQVSIDDCFIYGLNDSATTWQYSGIQLKASIANSPSSGILIRNCTIWYWYKGVETVPQGGTTGSSDYQGVYIRGCNLGWTYYGVYALSDDGHSDGLVIADNLFNSFFFGIYSKNWQHPLFHDNYVMMTDNGGLSGFTTTVGIHVEHFTGIFGSIHDNTVFFNELYTYFTSRTGIETTMSVTGTSLICNVHDNIVQNESTGNAFNLLFNGGSNTSGALTTGGDNHDNNYL